MLYLFVYFLGGVFFTNSVPHLVNGLSGRLFPTPFAHPPGKGKSSPVANVLWGWFNLAVGYVLIFWVGRFNIVLPAHAVAFGLGVLLAALLLAWHFGRVYGESNT